MLRRSSDSIDNIDDIFSRNVAANHAANSHVTAARAHVHMHELASSSGSCSARHVASRGFFQFSFFVTPWDGKEIAIIIEETIILWFEPKTGTKWLQWLQELSDERRGVTLDGH